MSEKLRPGQYVGHDGVIREWDRRSIAYVLEESSRGPFGEVREWWPPHEDAPRAARALMDKWEADQREVVELAPGYTKYRLALVPGLPPAIEYLQNGEWRVPCEPDEDAFPGCWATVARLGESAYRAGQASKPRVECGGEK